MYIESLCTPAVLFVMLMIFHLIFELYDENYSMAFLKLFCSVVMILFLQLLCSAHMEIIAWVIVFLPLIVYSYMTFLLFFVFGTDPSVAIKQYEVNKI
jgi:hypothetical protein